MYRQTLELRKKVLGPKYQDTLIGKNDLVNLLINWRKYDEAEQIYYCMRLFGEF